jgi:hypothetical protein
MKTIDAILEDLSNYAEAIAEDRLQELEKELNKIKTGKGTEMRHDFVEARKTLEDRRNRLAVYKSHEQPHLLTEATNLVGAFEKLRDTGKGAAKAVSLLGKLEDALGQVNILDDQVLDLLDNAARIATRQATLNRLGAPGTSSRNRFEDRADEISAKISDLQTRRLKGIISDFRLIQMDITAGIGALNKKAKQTEGIVQALKILNLLLGIATRALGLAV